MKEYDGVKVVVPLRRMDAPVPDTVEEGRVIVESLNEFFQTQEGIEAGVPDAYVVIAMTGIPVSEEDRQAFTEELKEEFQKLTGIPSERAMFMTMDTQVTNLYVLCMKDKKAVFGG